MNRSGVTPSIDNLAKLADEYVNTADKSAFAEKAVKILGRGYQTLIPLLAKGGNALREQTDAVDASLIATDKSIAASREYEVAMDSLDDTAKGLSMTFGNALIPELVKGMNVVNDFTSDVINFGRTQENLKVAVQDNIITMGEYRTILGEVRTRKMSDAEATEFLELRYDELHGTVNDTRDGLIKFTDSMKLETSAADESAEANSRVAIAIGDVTKASLGKTSLDALTEAYKAGTISENAYELAARHIMTTMLELPPNIINANLELANLTQSLALGTIAPLEYAAALEKMGIHLDYLDGKRSTSYVEVIYTDTYTSSGRPNIQGGQLTFPESGNAHGTDYVVPPGYNADGYNMGRASSGERVTVKPNNYTNTWNVYTNGGQQVYERDYNLRRALAN
jgi:hypothetical protein